MKTKDRKALENANHQFVVNINGVPVVILINDTDHERVIAGQFEITQCDNVSDVHVKIAPIENKEVLWYAQLIRDGIVNALKNEYDKKGD